MKNYRGRRKGFSITELALVLGIIGVMMLAAYMGYKKIYIPSRADNEYSKANMVINAIERAKNSLGGVYPAASGTFGSAVTDGTVNDTGLAAIVDEMGGEQGIADVADWTYDCSEGSDQTITLTTTNFDNPTIVRIVTRKVNRNNEPWVAEADGDKVVIKLDNVVCRTIN